jgi:acetyltransferase EpsM
MARPLVVIGGGEHAGSVIEAARSRGDEWRVEGIVDPAPADRVQVLLDVAHLGTDAELAGRLSAAPGDQDAPWLVLGFAGVRADDGRRGAAVERLGPEGRWATVIHETAWVAPSATLGAGTVVLAGAIVNAGATVGRHTIVNTRAVLEHDVELGDHAHVGPGAIVGGGAAVGPGALIGQGALIRDHVSIGARATVGMGAVVVADVEAGSTVAGNPARPLAGADG